MGLTAAARAEFVAGVDVYDQVVTYDDLGSLADGPAVYVDMSGDAAVRSAVHERLGESLAYDCLVGASHWDRMAGDSGLLSGPAPQLSPLRARPLRQAARGLGPRRPPEPGGRCLGAIRRVGLGMARGRSRERPRGRGARLIDLLDEEHPAVDRLCDGARAGGLAAFEHDDRDLPSVCPGRRRIGHASTIWVQRRSRSSPLQWLRGPGPRRP